MEKGSFITDTYNEENDVINMEGWLEPTLYNNGQTNVFINGMKLRPQGYFRLGPSNVAMYGSINLQFQGTGRTDIKVSYCLLQKNCSTNPPV